MGVPISNVTRRVVYAASGTGPYNFTFEILTATDIAVYRDDTLLTLTTNYTVTINSNGTGFVTLTASPTGATQVAIVGNRCFGCWRHVAASSSNALAGAIHGLRL